MPPAASTFARALAEAPWTVIESFLVELADPEQLDVLAHRANQPLRLERLGRHLLAGLEAVEIADVHGLRVGAERADRHRVPRRVAAQLGEAHRERHLAALEAGAHHVRAGARLLALDPAARVAALARADAAADPLAVLARLRRAQVGEVQLGRSPPASCSHYDSSTFTRWRTFRSMPASTGLVVVLGRLADPAEPERAQRAAVARRLADRASSLGQLASLAGTVGHRLLLAACHGCGFRLRLGPYAVSNLEFWEGQNVTDRLSACARHILRTAEIAKRLLLRGPD